MIVLVLRQSTIDLRLVDQIRAVHVFVGGRRGDAIGSGRLGSSASAYRRSDRFSCKTLRRIVCVARHHIQPIDRLTDQPRCVATGPILDLIGRAILVLRFDLAPHCVVHIRHHSAFRIGYRGDTPRRIVSKDRRRTRTTGAIGRLQDLPQLMARIVLVVRAVVPRVDRCCKCSSAVLTPCNVLPLPYRVFRRLDIVRRTAVVGRGSRVRIKSHHIRRIILQSHVLFDQSIFRVVNVLDDLPVAVPLTRDLLGPIVTVRLDRPVAVLASYDPLIGIPKMIHRRGISTLNL